MRIICSAWEEETKYLSKEVREKFIIYHLGIGYLSAALNLQKIILENKLTEINFLGTAGLVQNTEEKFSINDTKVYRIEKSSLLRALTITGSAYTPVTYPSYSLNNANTNKTLKSLTTANCISSLEISKSAELSSKILDSQSNTEILLENMELYGVAKLASEYQIPCNTFLSTSNFTNANAHQDWKENHQKASEKLCKVFREKNS